MKGGLWLLVALLCGQWGYLWVFLLERIHKLG